MQNGSKESTDGNLSRNLPKRGKDTRTMNDQIMALTLAWSIVVACFIIETTTRK
jgi:hypothetical protein